MLVDASECGGQRLVVDVFHITLCLVALKHCLTKLEASCLSETAWPECSQHLPVAFPSAVLQACAHMPRFLHGCWGVKLRSLHLQNKCFYPLSHPPAPYMYFEDRETYLERLRLSS